MTDLRTAAQQALEALKMMRDEYEEYACPACDHAYAAIYALRAALAEEALQRLTDVQQEMEQEPVAWIDDSGHPKHIRHLQSVTERRLYGPLRPLYTAPPQRKPLTEEQVERAYLEIWSNSSDDFGPTAGDWVESGIRYAERVHGIGEQK